GRKRSRNADQGYASDRLRSAQSSVIRDQRGRTTHQLGTRYRRDRSITALGNRTGQPHTAFRWRRLRWRPTTARWWRLGRRRTGRRRLGQSRWLTRTEQRPVGWRGFSRIMGSGQRLTTTVLKHHSYSMTIPPNP